MKNQFLVIWKDTVWSKVIATSITAVLGMGWLFLSGDSFNAFLAIASKPINFPLWIVLLFILPLCFIAAKHLIKINRKKPYISDTNDVIAIVDSWWLKNISNWSATVNFEDVENEFNLQPGSVSNIIEKVAQDNGYSVKSRGEKVATFSRNIPSSKAIY
jgi:hypothetical protein